MKQADLKPTTSLQPHQARVRDRVLAGDDRLLLYMGVGTGKSLASLAAAEAAGGPYVAAMPASLRPNFRGEIARHTDRTTPSDVLSYTALARGEQPRVPPRTVILDEAQNLRNPETAQARAATDLARRADRVLLLSGTPIVNAPGDLATPLNILAGTNHTAQSFEKRYLGTERQGPGLLGWLLGRKATYRPAIKNRGELERLLRNHVDYQAPRTPEGVTTTDRTVDVELDKDQDRFNRAIFGRLSWPLRWKLQHSYPVSDADLRKLRSFFSGSRAAGLSLYPFGGGEPLEAFNGSAKLRAAGEHLLATLHDPRRKALVYSNLVQAGLVPYSAFLAKHHIPHALFHGGLTDEERRKAVEDYNAGRSRVLLMGPSAAEGISTQGTSLLEILDPNWNEARSQQARGRGLRYDSHSGLPADLRDVTVERYLAHGRRPGLLGRLFGGEQMPTADEILSRMAQSKEETNEVFRRLLREVGTEKAAGSDMVGPGSLPGRLIAGTLGRLNPDTWLTSALLAPDRPMAGLRNPTQRDEEKALARFRKAHPDVGADELPAIRIGGSNTWDDLKRVWKNPQTTLAGKLYGTIETPVENLAPPGTPFLPGSDFGRSSKYNPFANSVTVYSDLPEVSLHELGHAGDFGQFYRRARKGSWASRLGARVAHDAYAGVRHLPILTLLAAGVTRAIESEPPVPNTYLSWSRQHAAVEAARPSSHILAYLPAAGAVGGLAALWQELAASRAAGRIVGETASGREKARETAGLWSRLAPAFGTYAGGFAGLLAQPYMPDLAPGQQLIRSLAFPVGGALAGHAVAGVRNLLAVAGEDADEEGRAASRHRHAAVSPKAAGTLDDLRRAKKESDRRHYGAKHRLLRGLLEKNPGEFYVDSRNGAFAGITHRPSGFKIHYPARHLPDGVEDRSGGKSAALSLAAVATAEGLRPRRRRPRMAAPRPAAAPPAAQEPSPAELLRELVEARRLRMAKAADGWAAVPDVVARLVKLGAGPLEAAQEALGGPSALTNALVYGAAGAGAGNLAGRLAEAMAGDVLPAGSVRRGKGRRVGTAIGAALGGLAWPAYRWSVAMRAPGGPAEGDGLGALSTPWPWRPEDVKRADAILEAMVPMADVPESARKAADALGGLGATGALFVPSIPVDAFNNAVFVDAGEGPNPFGTRDPYGDNSQPMRTPPAVAAAASGAVAAAGAARGSGLVSPWDVAVVAGRAGGAGWLGGLALGKTIGALAGLSPAAQQRLRQAGLWGGLLTGAVRAAFGG